LTQTLAGKTRTFLEMIKIEHSIFALPFAYLGLILGERGWPRLEIFIWVTAAMVSFRTMAMGFNRLIDMPIDRDNPRTSARALPAGKLKPGFVWWMTLLAFFLFEVSAAQLGTLCLSLSPWAAFLAWLYPFAKRFTWLSHFLLGIILAMAPYGAWIGSRHDFSWIPGLFSIGIAAWVAGFDIIYALQDEEFDRQYGLFSFPARFGKAASLRLTQILHVLTVVCWLGAGILAGLGAIYFAGLVLVVIFLVREHWLVASFGLKKLEEAFFTMNAIVSLSVFAAVLADYSLGGILR